MWWCVVGVWGWSHLTSKNKMGEKSRVALYSREGARTRDRSSCSASSTIQAREQEALCTQLHSCLNRSQPTEGFQGALLNIIFHLWSKREVEGLHELKNEFLSLRTWLQEDCLSYCIPFVHIFCVCVCVCVCVCACQGDHTSLHKRLAFSRLAVSESTFTPVFDFLGISWRSAEKSFFCAYLHNSLALSNEIPRKL